MPEVVALKNRNVCCEKRNKYGNDYVNNATTAAAAGATAAVATRR
jgi:hypothetical protein